MNTPPPLLIAAINARYSHASLGARYLLANMGDLRPQTDLVEFTQQQSAAEIGNAIVARHPTILALGVYIWNAGHVADLLPLLRRQLPDMVIVLGGPEIAEMDPPGPRPGLHPIQRIALAQGADLGGYSDFLLPGEADLAFAALCRDILSSSHPCSSVSIRGCLHPPLPPDLAAIQLPYDEYSSEDLSRRLLYVETSRGCAMRCDYCVSANDESVRFFPLPPLLTAFDKLLVRGARHFKFCDRSFNLNISRAVEVLAFFLERLPRFPGLVLHFEMLPDRFPTDLRDVLARFPPRSLQLEIGIQSFNSAVLDLIRRPQILDRAVENLRFLREQTHAYLHTDLIAGLPGETPESFAAGFNRLVALGPHEVQLGILKKLPGAPIDRHDAAFAMHYNPASPYNIRSTRDWPADHLLRTARFAHYWDAIVNSNRFLAAAPLLWQHASSIFDAFMTLADWMGARFPQEHGIPLPKLVEAVFEYLTQARHVPEATAAEALIRGYRHAGARDIPPALAPHLHGEPPPPTRGLPKPLRRQFLFWTWDSMNPAVDAVSADPDGT